MATDSLSSAGGPVPVQSRNLDVLRAVAVLLVYFSHLLYSILGIARIGPVGHDVIGRAGVIFFFVHTCLVLLKSLDRTALSGWRLTVDFYLRRAFRIYPLSIVVVLTMVLFHIPEMPTEVYSPVSVQTLLGNLALVQNLTNAPDVLGPLWSLPWEVQMYVAMPLIFFALRARSVATAWLLWFVVLVVRIGGLAFHIKLLSLLGYAPCFLVGAVIWRSPGRLSRFSPRWFPLAILGAGATYVAVRETVTWQPIFVAAYAASLVLGIALPCFGDLSPSPLSRACHFVAKYSYGIYLSHVPLMWIARVPLAGVNPFLRWGFLATASIAVPILLFHVLEDPLIGIGKRLIRSQGFHHPVRSREKTALPHGR